MISNRTSKRVTAPVSNPVMSSGVSVADIQAAGGDSSVWAIDANVFVAGTPPDVASAANQWGTNGDLVTGIDSTRPHASGGGASAIFTHDRAAVQELFNDAISPVFIPTLNNVTMFIVAKPAAGTNEYLLDLTNNPASNNQGMSFQHLGATGTFRVRTRTAARSLTNVSIDFTPDDDFHIFEGSIQTENLTVGIDGVIKESLGTTAGISLDQDGVSVGNNAGTGTPSFDGPVKFACALLDPTDEERLAVREAIQARYGTPALPEISPVTIHPSQCAWYINVEDGRVMGTPPDIETLTNLADPSNANITQAVAILKPHLIDVGGKDYAAVVDDTNNVYWDNLAVGTPLWSAGETHVKIGFVASFNDLTANRYLFDMGLTNAQTGISILQLTSSRIRVVIHAGGSTAFCNFVATSTDEHYWEGRYDGANITLWKDGVQVAIQAKTGTMSNDCDDISVGRHLNAGQYANSNLRTAALIIGATTAAQDAAQLAWGLDQV